MHPWRDARRARARADQWEQVAALRGREADTLRRDRDGYAAALAAEQERVRVLQDRAATGEGVTVARLRAGVARLRETVAALDARGDELRRAVTHWESTHSACERARQLVERDAEQAAQWAEEAGA